MRLYSMNGTAKVVHNGEEYEADEDGGFEVPHEVGEHLRGVHIGGEKAWEDDGERSIRKAVEEEARRRDPATLLAAVERLAMEQARSDKASSDEGDQGGSKQQNRGGTRK